MIEADAVAARAIRTLLFDVAPMYVADVREIDS
jgi:hypothetical protein